ncbi:Prefoldin [Ostreococcus tauri]|uniref:Prefoldin n=1 Tax=Ostreococcus tauri TaxID=70448 RepID=A0A090LY93_OSTTA|nr:Prefoldin [Ostreococcus tauri]CEF96741.1 Prefoldin [Ostreococcus tauri]|eukprot:XP_022838271.1 Prefoldin [Ostreococcus tauri]
MATPQAMFAAMQKKLTDESRTYETLGEEMSANAIARQQASQQLSENEMVLKELELLEDEAKVYKLIGPVLMKQDLEEARGNVGKRLDYIRAESERLEKKAGELQKKQLDKQKDIMELQQKMMALANPSGGE